MKRDIKESIFSVGTNNFTVAWESYDFSRDVAGIPDVSVRTVLMDSGVMYVAQADPKIRVSHLLEDLLQGYSALHEQLFQENKVADCPDVEGMVVDAIDDMGLKREYIDMRHRMFCALCLLYTENPYYSASQRVLDQKKQEI